MITKRIVLQFPQTLVEQALVYRLVKDYNLIFNILKAYISPEEGGRVVMELSGENKDYEDGIKFLTDKGINVTPLSQDVIRNDQRCIHCGVCVPVCPTGSFVVESTKRDVNFYDDKCIACGLCVKICPFHAMEISFQ